MTYVVSAPAAPVAPARLSRKARVLKDSMPIFISAVGRKFGVRLVFQGTEMKTDGKTIWVPSVDLDDDLLREMIYGVTIHECGHVRYTDFSVVREVTETGNLLLKEMLNVVEDGRLELGIRSEYPGFVKFLSRVIDWLISKGMMAAMTEELSPADILTGYTLLRMRADVLGQQQLLQAADQSEAIALKVFPEGAVRRLNILIQEVRRLESTSDASELAAAILEMLKEEEEKARQSTPSPDQQNQDPAGPNGDTEGAAHGPDSSPTNDAQQSDDNPGAIRKTEGESGDQNDVGNNTGSPGDKCEGTDGVTGGVDNVSSEGDGTSGQPGETKQPQSNPDVASNMADGGDSGAASKSDGNAAGAPQVGSRADGDGPDAAGNGSGDYDPSKAEFLGDALKGVGGVSSRDIFGGMCKKVGEEVQKFPLTQVPALSIECKPHEDVERGRQILAAVKGNSVRVRTQLKALVDAATRSRYHVSHRGKTTDSRRLSRVLTSGDTRVFRTKIDARLPNAAVHILIDRSLSMDDTVSNDGTGRKISRLEVALGAGIALADALEGIEGVNPALTAFPGTQSGQSLVDMVERTSVLPLMRHGQRVKNAMATFCLSSGGGTPLANAMWYCAAQLAVQREERKVLMVVTDGEPDDKPAVKGVIERYQASGFEVIGIGIQKDSVSDLFPIYAVIRDPADLRGAMFDIARSTMLGI